MDKVIVSSAPRKSRGRKPIRYIDGYSESLFKSLAVKSLRMGWPEGLRQAAKGLSPSTMKALLVCGLFEDVFPTPAELRDCLGEIASKDYDALCARQTHHARGNAAGPYTQAFCDLEDEAVLAADVDKPALWREANKYGLWLPPRSLNCFYTWLRLRPMDVGSKRSLDLTPWTGSGGMPEAMADGHTVEGKALGATVTLLSGHYSQHLAISQRVARDGGWDAIRTEVHDHILKGATL